jgi:hypothetical protein
MACADQEPRVDVHKLLPEVPAERGRHHAEEAFRRLRRIENILASGFPAKERFNQIRAFVEDCDEVDSIEAEVHFLRRPESQTPLEKLQEAERNWAVKYTCLHSPRVEEHGAPQSAGPSSPKKMRTDEGSIAEPFAGHGEAGAEVSPTAATISADDAGASSPGSSAAGMSESDKKALIQRNRQAALEKKEAKRLLDIAMHMQWCREAPY